MDWRRVCVLAAFVGLPFGIAAAALDARLVSAANFEHVWWRAWPDSQVLALLIPPILVAVAAVTLMRSRASSPPSVAARVVIWCSSFFYAALFVLSTAADISWGSLGALSYTSAAATVAVVLAAVTSAAVVEEAPTSCSG